MEPIIVVENLSYTYPPIAPGHNPVPVLKNINLIVNKGEFLAIMGPTGVGKTTLCLALTGIVPHFTAGRFSGNVTIAGMNTRKYSAGELSSRVGMVFQDPESQLFNMTIEDELSFGLESRGIPSEQMVKRIDRALNVVHMGHLKERSPFHLSGGQKQRVAIAAILALEPEILILDEPTSALDPIGKEEVFAVVDELRQTRDMTIIMVEQESERIAEFSDRVVILDNHGIRLDDSPQEVFTSMELLHNIGVGVPQVAEIAQLLNKSSGANHRFITIDHAIKALI